jgi:uncharacterized zinc-type alcohol dehydrogenase-like protein
MTQIIRAFAANEPRGKFLPFEYEAGELRPEEIEVKVEYCGICHSDLSMRDNEWAMTSYPFVGGHEAIGTVTAVGEMAKGVNIGDRVGIGWNAESCMQCEQCLSGYQINCPNIQGVIVGRHGGFAERVRIHWAWAVKLPTGLNIEKAGPLFCGGITVFNPFVQLDIKPTDRVGVVGIGGLGHLALQFADKWGCEVTAFTSDLTKADELRALGADHVVNSRDSEAITALAGKFDMILVTVNVPLDWKAYFAALRPKGKLHIVGAILKPIPVGAFDLIMNQKAVTGTATGSPSVVARMLEFCERHKIEPVIEKFPMSAINDAFDHLETGKPRYRIVLEADFD